MERKLSTLDLALRQRPYVKSPSGTFQSQRKCLDFVIDGQVRARVTAIVQRNAQSGGDSVTVLEWSGVR